MRRGIFLVSRAEMDLWRLNLELALYAWFVIGASVYLMTHAAQVFL